MELKKIQKLYRNAKSKILPNNKEIQSTSNLDEFIKESGDLFYFEEEKGIKLYKEKSNLILVYGISNLADSNVPQTSGERETPLGDTSPVSKNISLEQFNIWREELNKTFKEMIKQFSSEIELINNRLDKLGETSYKQSELIREIPKNLIEHINIIRKKLKLKELKIHI